MIINLDGILSGRFDRSSGVVVSFVVLSCMDLNVELIAGADI